MNGKIKTKFAALFAVALMITVCVVPVVGGSEDVEAADPGVTIKGYVYNADGTSGIDGAIVYIGSTYDKDMKLQAVTGDDPLTAGVQNGYFSIAKVPKGDIVVNVVTNDKDKGAYNLAMPTITLKNVTSEQTVKFVAGTVQVEGQLVKKDQNSSSADVPVFLKDVAIMSGRNQMAVTDENGKYSFLAKVGSTYTLTASTGTGISFKSEQFTVTEGTAGVDDGANLRAEQYIFDANVTIPVGTLTTEIVGGTDDAKQDVAFASLGSVLFGYDGTSYHAYAPLTYNTITATQESVSLKVTMNYDPYGTNGLGSVYGNINGTDKDLTYTTGFTMLPTGYVSGEVFIGDDTAGAYTVKIVPKSVILTAKKDGALDVTKTAEIVDGKYYVGTNNDPALTGYNVSYAVSYDGYTFAKKTGSDDYYSVNEALVDGQIGPIGTEFDIDANYIVIADELKSETTGKYVAALEDVDSVTAGDQPGYKFFVPKGTSVTITAPANYVPASETISAVNSDVTISTFTYVPTITYTGQVLLNGVPIVLGTPDSTTGEETSSFSFSVDSGESWSDAEVYWKDIEEGAPYYTIALDREYDSSEILFRIKTDSDGVQGGYQFDKSEEGNYTSSVGITGTTIGTFNVKASELTVTAKDNSLLIPGMEFTYYMLKANGATAATSFNEDLVIAELGKATTDAEGKAILNAAKPNSSVDKYTIFAVTDGQSDFGKYPEKKTNNVTSGTVAAEFNNMTIYGFYTADASAIPGLEISYIEKEGATLVSSGKATIIDNMYYIVLKKTDNFAYLSVDESKYDPDFAASYNKGLKNIVIEVVADNLSVNVEILENEYFKFIKVSEYSANPVKGDVIVLSAEKSCYRLQNGGLQYEYTDAAVKYDFAGWYVNGKLLTEDCDTAITLSEDVVIVAQYDEAVKVIGSQDVPEAGLDTNVLILGIVVVVIALIAVVYSVISKRD